MAERVARLSASPAVVAVAYSGGRDSTALAFATARVAARDGMRVVALHVHHGLSPRADAWLEHCRHQCEQWAAQGWPITLEARRVRVSRSKGSSLEAEARKSRYAALAEMARGCGAQVVLLAHHQDDQAETFLLQALRGGGLGGLAAMPRAAERDGLVWLRPWLDRPRADIERYVAHQRLGYIDDDSNADPRFLRNRLRLQVMPVLQDAFPGAAAALARAAAQMQEGLEVSRAVVQNDLQACVRAGDADGASASLAVEAWRGLSAERASAVLRTWFAQQAQAPMPRSLCGRLLDEVFAQATRHVGRWPAPGGEVVCHRAELRYRPAAPPATGRLVTGARQERLTISRAGRYRLLGWGGCLVAKRVTERGLALSWPLVMGLRERSGGEQFQAGPGRPPRSLKKQFQDAGLPAEGRQGPLVYVGDRLVFVPGLGIDARAWGPPGQPQIVLEWVPDRPASG